MADGTEKRTTINALEGAPSSEHPTAFVTNNEQRDLRRGLAQRHIQMIALAGAFDRADRILHLR